MAQTATVKGKFKHDNEQFPIHYKRGCLQVFTNPSGDLFVEDTRSGVFMRISPSHPDGLEFTTDGRVDPIRVSNMIGWRVQRR